MAKKTKTKKPVARKTVARKKKVSKTKKVSAIPAGYHSVTPYLVCRDAAAAIDFYKTAFGARLKLRMDGPDGKIGHAELAIGDSVVMLGEENLHMGSSSPQTIGGTASGLFIYAAGVDKLYARAIAAGCTAEMPPTDMFWGDRYCKLSDPFGHKWSMATHTEDVTPKEMARRGAEWMRQQGGGQ